MSFRSIFAGGLILAASFAGTNASAGCWWHIEIGGSEWRCDNPPKPQPSHLTVYSEVNARLYNRTNNNFSFKVGCDGATDHDRVLGAGQSIPFKCSHSYAKNGLAISILFISAGKQVRMNLENDVHVDYSNGGYGIFAGNGGVALAGNVPAPTYSPVIASEIPGGTSLKWLEFIAARNEWVEWTQFGGQWRLIAKDGSVLAKANQTERNTSFAKAVDTGGGTMVFYSNGVMEYSAANGQKFVHHGTLYKKIAQ